MFGREDANRLEEAVAQHVLPQLYLHQRLVTKVRDRLERFVDLMAEDRDGGILIPAVSEYRQGREGDALCV